MRLSRAMVAHLPPAIRRPPRGEIGTGIVHFGPGAFHRAHQASYIDTLLDHDPRWGIAAVSMRSRGTVAALSEQEGFYTIAVRDAEPSFRLIDAHRAFLGPENAAETRRLLADAAIELVTMTVTEKGYCLAPDGTLDLGHVDIVAELAGTDTPRSVIGWIVAGLAARRAAGTAPFTVMPCDNLAANGRKIHAALVAFAAQHDADLARWISDEVHVPCTMVDSITPASDDALYADVAGVLGMEDRAAVQREAFVQWVIEDTGQGGPDLAAAGATLTSDVTAWERAKLRILNGAHSALAYIGLLRGAVTVAEAMADADLARFVETMIARDIAPTLPASLGLDLDAYAAAVLRRFRNPVIVHRLEQIAQDGTQKLPYRLGDTLAANREAGRLPAQVIAAFGAWVAFVMTRARAGTPIVDPAATALKEVGSAPTAAQAVDRLVERGLGLPVVVAQDPALLNALRTAATIAHRRNWASLFA
jgi:fructuronate reductase